MDSLGIQHDLFLHVWRLSWQASLLAGGILILQAICGKLLSAKWRYRLWLLVVARLLLPVSLETPLSLYNLIPWRDGGKEEISSPAFPNRAADFRALSQTQVTPATSHDPTRAGDVLLSAGPFAIQSVATRLRPANGRASPQVIAGMWLLGVALMTSGMALQYLSLRIRLSCAQPVHDETSLQTFQSACARMHFCRRVQLLTTDAVPSPALFGFFRPKLLILAGLLQNLSCEELRSIFGHEIAHLKRRDVPINWLMAALQIVHWFNPALWWVFARMRADREIACDALALGSMDRPQRKVYGKTIIRLLENATLQSWSRGLVGLLGTGGQIHRRIRAIARHDEHAHRSKVSGIILGVVGVIGLTDRRTVLPLSIATVTSAAAKPAASQQGNSADLLLRGRRAFVKGSVFDRKTGLPVPAFSVHLRDSRSLSSPYGSTTTWVSRSKEPVAYGKEGEFHLLVLSPSQSYSLEVHAAGYALATSDWFSITNEQRTLTFSLERISAGRELQPTPAHTQGAHSL